MTPALAMIDRSRRLLRSIRETPRGFGTPGFWRLSGLILVGFLLLFATVDAELSQALRQGNETLIGVFKAFADSGNSKWYLWPFGLLVIACYLLRLTHPRTHIAALYGWACSYFFFLFWAIAFSGILTNVIKIALGRARPKLLDQEGLYGFFPPGLEGVYHSFPSGHANTLFALAVALILFWPRGRTLLLILAAILASSRFMVNKHFISDVIAGAGFAALTTLWLRDFFASYGIAFCQDRHGRARLKAEGRLLRRWLWRAFRRRLPALVRASRAKA